jgi:hypothetical protein
MWHVKYMRLYYQPLYYQHSAINTILSHTILNHPLRQSIFLPQVWDRANRLVWFASKDVSRPRARMSPGATVCCRHHAACLPPARMSPGKGTEPAGHTSCIAAENDSLPPMCCRLQPAARVSKERVVQRIVLRCVFKWYNGQQSSNADCSVQEVKNVRRNHACFRTEA